MNRALGVLLLPLLAALLVLPGFATGAAAAYRPVSGDQFSYTESVTVSDGQGNYSGYTEEGSYLGSISVASVAPNGTVNASYRASGSYHNSLGANYPWSENGTFAFSSVNYLYTRGTDNQTGYTNPTVWFLIDPSLGRGATFQLLNTPMTVVSTNATFATSASSTGYATAIFAEGNGTYERNDVYGKFTATYNWKAFFDPKTGYCLGYVDTETDSDGAGDGFTYIDSLTDSQTSFPLTTAAAPPPPPPNSSPPPQPTAIEVVVGLVALLVVVVVVVYEFARRRRSPLPRHSASTGPGTMPPYQPPPVNLIPGDQPTIQQVVVRETVKVPCRYCGTLMDSTATVCPKCGAPRT